MEGSEHSLTHTHTHTHTHTPHSHTHSHTHTHTHTHKSTQKMGLSGHFTPLLITENFPYKRPPPPPPNPSAFATKIYTNAPIVNSHFSVRM